MRAGMLEAIRPLKSDSYGKLIWLCRCDCGNEIERQSSIMVQAIKKGKNSNCGCQPTRKTHGLTASNKKLYWVWAAMIQRCTNPKSKDFYNYGAKGINVHDDWRKFENFHKWAMSNGYADGLSIDRTNNLKGYNPENCAFVGIKNQMRNQKKTRKFEWNGKLMALTELAEIAGISPQTMRQRLVINGWTVHKAMTTAPKIGRNQHD